MLASTVDRAIFTTDQQDLLDLSINIACLGIVNAPGEYDMRSRLGLRLRKT